jgi:hypothetical protein
MLDHVLGVGAYTSPATVYMALLTTTADDTDDGDSITEATYTGYARKAISFGAASNRVITQDADCDFDPCTVGSSTVTHWAICDSLTSGEVLAWGALSGSQEIVAGNTPSIVSGETTITFSTGGVSTYCANAILNHLFDNTTFTQPTIYAGLTTTTIVDADGGGDIDEVADSNGYAREAVASWDAAAAGATANTSTITMGPPTSTGWGTIVASFLADSGTHGAGNILFYDNSTVDQAVAGGDTVTYASGAWDITLD